jgi:hypothetical protein
MTETDERPEPPPVNTTYRWLSRQAADKALIEWMLEQCGNPRELDDEAADKWYRDEGMISHFLRDLLPE